jgi:hypothetical protein
LSILLCESWAVEKRKGKIRKAVNNVFITDDLGSDAMYYFDLIGSKRLFVEKTTSKIKMKFLVYNVNYFTFVPLVSI